MAPAAPVTVVAPPAVAAVAPVDRVRARRPVIAQRRPVLAGHS